MQSEFYNSNIIILLGYMGSGKSTVGKALAAHLNITFEDLDHSISSQYNCTIPELFSAKGAKAFRQIEHDLLDETLKNPSARVISLGGGTPCYHNNMDLITQTTPNVFYLKANPKTLSNRLLPARKSRPLIAHLDSETELTSFVAKHLFERQSFYNLASHNIVIDHKTIDRNAAIKMLNKLIFIMSLS